jgi:hypothetical protein
MRLYGAKWDHFNFFLPDIVRQIKSRRLRWAGHVANMGDRGEVYKLLVVSPKERDHLKDQGVNGRMGLECILGRRAGGV